MPSKATFIKMATCVIFPPMITFGIACIFLGLLGSCITAGAPDKKQVLATQFMLSCVCMFFVGRYSYSKTGIELWAIYTL